MGDFIFVLGGARSGKSRYAAELAEVFNGKVTFIATADPHDEEMKERIARHKAERSKDWNLVEENKNVDLVLSKMSEVNGIVLIDCLGLLVSNLIGAGRSDEEIEKKIGKMISTVLEKDLNAIIVSNDVGGGIVPINPLARRFRDVIGLANQKCAANADKVIVMHAGIPVVIKG